MFGLGNILGPIVSFFGTIFQGLVSNPRTAIAVIFGLILYLASVSGAYFYGSGYFEGEGRGTPMVRMESPLTVAEMLRATPPTSASVSRKPDTSNVDTVRVVTLESTVEKDTVVRWFNTPDVDFTKPNFTLETRLESSPYKFLLLPTVDGRPTINVTEDRTRVDALDPRDASNIRINYDHPEPFLEAGPLLRSSAIKSSRIYTQGIVGGWIRHKAFRLDVGFRFSSVEEMTGPTLGLEYSPTILDF